MVKQNTKRRGLILLISAVLLLLAPEVRARANTVKTTEQDKQCETDEQINNPHKGLFHFSSFPHYNRAWFSPILLGQYWHDPASSLTAPTYKLNADATKFVLSYETKGYNADEIDIELSANGDLLHIKGEKSEHAKDYDSVTKFHHSFALDPKVHTEEITAKIDKTGNLIVTVPRKTEKSKPSCTKIPISVSQEAKTK
jgi:HSP20 family molecular chaperone IbpA